MKITAFEMLTLSCCCYGMLTVVRASEQNLMHGDSIITVPHLTSNLLNRVKRQGGGGIIPFRPLFVYRQQQRERQEKWKEIEARKKLREQLLQYQQYDEVIKQDQQSYPSRRPHISSISNNNPTTTQYTAYNYPYTSNSLSSYYNQYDYDKYPKDPYSNYYRNYYRNYYQNYYSVYDDYS